MQQVRGVGVAPGGRPLAFVDNQVCAQCHARQFGAWKGSHHERAMQPAAAQTVLGDFNDARYTDFGVTSRFFKKGEQFFINTEGADGRYADFEVEYTFGVAPLQQYLLAFAGGRLQAFTIAWDVEQRRWFNLYPDEKIAPMDPLHWTRRHFTWNSSCAECHSTDLRPNYDGKTGSYQTTWAAINVGCQACHGPGNRHIAWAQGGHSPMQHKGLVVDYKSLNAQEQVDTCAGCHARRYPVSADDQPGQPLLDHFMPELLRPGLYHADGQIQDEVFEYGPFIQSKMYQQGVSCQDCHDPHTLRLRREGNHLCVACHQPNPPMARFATLRAKAYDTPAHHFHPADSAGAQCVGCHMPAKTYMVIDPRRDRSLRLPRPDLSVKLGVPDACHGCHADKDATWAVARMTEWYGSAWQDRPHFAQALAAGRTGAPAAAPALSRLAQDASQPAIARATALDLLSESGIEGEGLATALTDPAPLVRAAAAQAGTTLTDERKLALLTPLLRDPLRAVRIEAARTLATVDQPAWDAAQREAFAAALAEYKAAQLAQADHPEGHANLGRLYAARGDLALAEQAFQTAVARDAHFWPAANGLATIYAQTKRQREAEQVLRQAIAATPDQGTLYQSLGLLLAEEGRLPAAVEQLAQAAALLPDHPRVHYNHGLLLQQMGQIAEAERALRRASELRPADPDVLYALIAFYTRQGQREQARAHAERLVQFYPGVPEFQRLAESLQQ